MAKLERFKAAASECARPKRVRHRALRQTPRITRLPWWIAMWLPGLGVSFRTRVLFWWLKVTGRL
jgi:hypothetical protein